MSNQEEVPEPEATMEEAIVYLGVTRPTLQKWVNEKKILSHLKGGRRFIKLLEIRRFQKHGNHPDAEQGKHK